MRNLITLLPCGWRALSGLGALLLLVGCGPRPVRIGAVLPLTGGVVVSAMRVLTGVEARTEVAPPDAEQVYE